MLPTIMEKCSLLDHLGEKILQDLQVCGQLRMKGRHQHGFVSSRYLVAVDRCQYVDIGTFHLDDGGTYEGHGDISDFQELAGGVETSHLPPECVPFHRYVHAAKIWLRLMGYLFRKEDHPGAGSENGKTGI